MRIIVAVEALGCVSVGWKGMRGGWDLHGSDGENHRYYYFCARVHLEIPDEEDGEET
jgi:hypothetical protein